MEREGESDYQAKGRGALFLRTGIPLLLILQFIQVRAFPS